MILLHSSIHCCGLVVVLVLANLVALVSSSNTGDIRRCSSKRFKSALRCNDTITTISNVGNFIIQYDDFGKMECSGAYTLSQTQTIPNVTLLSAEIGSYYTLLLVDTSDS
jgi:hypothetical protein